MYLEVAESIGQVLKILQFECCNCSISALLPISAPCSSIIHCFKDNQPCHAGLERLKVACSTCSTSHEQFTRDLNFAPFFSSISLSRSPLEQLEAEKEEREQKLKKMEQEMEQVFEMKVKEKKKKLKDSEAEVSGIVVQRSKVIQLGFTMSDEVFQDFALVRCVRDGKTTR